MIYFMKGGLSYSELKELSFEELIMLSNNIQDMSDEIKRETESSIRK